MKKKLRIAILTHPLGKNYGGIMQAFALQNLLKSLGHEVSTFDIKIQDPKITHRFKRYCYRVILKLLGKRKAPINLEKHYPIIFKDTKLFISKYINVTEEINCTADFNKHFDDNQYDAVIVGSDQTWRPKYVTNIYNYYLDFLADRSLIKLAYASSFGVDVWEYTEEETLICSKLVKKFDAISVREQSGVELCRLHLNIASSCVLDPTLLLDKTDYLTFFGIKQKESSGIFTYWLDSSSSKKSATDKLANEWNKYSYSSQSISSIGNLNSRNVDDYIIPPVEEWLASFANAEAVLTDSFHGMVFSIIFQKPFIVVINRERGASRFQSLLEKLELENRIVEDASKISIELLNKPIPEFSYTKLKELQHFSIDFLQNNLNK